MQTVILGHTGQNIGETFVMQKLKNIFGTDEFTYYNLYDVIVCEKELYILSEINRKLLTENNIKLTPDNFIAKKIKEKLSEKVYNSRTVVILITWESNTLGVLHTGISKTNPIIMRNYTSFPDTSINLTAVPAVNACDIVLAQSPLGVLKLLEFNVPKHKIVLFPPTYSYWNNLNMNFLKSSKIKICIYGRLLACKNIEITLEVLSEVYEKYKNFTVVLKGSNRHNTPQNLLNLIDKMSKFEWFQHDDSNTPFSKIHEYYSNFDLFISMSGREGSGNATIEISSLGKTIILLNDTVNPFLFKDMCIFVNSKNYLRDGRFKYATPDKNDLKKKIIEVLLNKQLREKIEKKSKILAESRFSQSLTKKRLDIAITAAYTYKHGTSIDIDKMQDIVKRQLEYDVELFK
jgi:glycosyltransferase involved in cell wall biosynthesis